jgi:hypothetical protein
VPGLANATFNHLDIAPDLAQSVASLPFLFHEKPSVDIGIRDVMAVRHYLAHSDAPWFAQMINDTRVNVAKLQTMFDDLRRIRDPLHPDRQGPLQHQNQDDEIAWFCASIQEAPQSPTKSGSWRAR